MGLLWIYYLMFGAGVLMLIFIRQIVGIYTHEHKRHSHLGGSVYKGHLRKIYTHQSRQTHHGYHSDWGAFYIYLFVFAISVFLMAFGIAGMARLMH